MILILDLPSIFVLSLSKLHHSMTQLADPLSNGVTIQDIGISLSSGYPNTRPLTSYSICLYLSSPSLHPPSNISLLLCLTQLLWSTHLTNICLLSQYNDYHLTFASGLKSNTSSVILSDISHHHLCISIILSWERATLHDLSSINILGYSHLQSNSSIALSPLPFGYNTTPNITSQDIYSLPSSSILSHDPAISSTTYLHHSWIDSLAILASSLHLTIHLMRDYTHSAIQLTPSTILLADKSSALSSITYMATYLGCHTLSIYVHNDTCLPSSSHSLSISLEPVLSQLIQESGGKHLSNTSSITQQTPSSNKSLSSSIPSLNPGDLYTHHSIAVGLHITTSILLKGCLDSKLTHLYPDKTQQHYAFSCDGPSRGGTCDISSWDSFYLTSFWVLNTLAWTTFFFHWKHLTLLTSSPSIFDYGSTYLNGWFRDYLWFNSSALIQGYNTHGANDLSTWSWIFLGAHLLFATSFMFLIS